MSIDAISWAFSQRDLKPAAKLVLVFLGDCHNKHTKRCDPSQELLARECEMSRSTLNLHLKNLEIRGLIRRVLRFDAQTKKRKNTFYILGCDDEKPLNVEKAMSENRTWKSTKAMSEKQAKPCPKNSKSHVRRVGHKPEDNQKRTCARENGKPFFTDDERFEAKQIAEHINGGGTINPNGVSPRVRCCLLVESMISKDVAEQHGIAEKRAGGKNG